MSAGNVFCYASVALAHSHFNSLDCALTSQCKRMKVMMNQPCWFCIQFPTGNVSSALLLYLPKEKHLPGPGGKSSCRSSLGIMEAGDPIAAPSDSKPSHQSSSVLQRTVTTLPSISSLSLLEALTNEYDFNLPEQLESRLGRTLEDMLRTAYDAHTLLLSCLAIWHLTDARLHIADHTCVR